MKKENTFFLGSTYEDLKTHRRMILDALIQLKHGFQAMEYWAPSANTTLEQSLKKLRKTKIYIGIIGARYGSVVKDGKSITQLEYEEAVKLGLERHVYFIDEEKHPVTLYNVDRGENAIKLKDFQNLISSQSVRGRFQSPGDLVAQVIINIIDLLKEEGEDIRAALNEHGVSAFFLKTGYSLLMSEESLDVSSLIGLNEQSVFTIKDEYIESVAAAAVIAKNLSSGNFDIINNFVTFKPEVFKIVVFLIKDLGIDESALAKAINDCVDATILRLLINIAGRVGAAGCAEIICRRALSSQKYHRTIQSYDIQITPFNDIVKIALSRLPAKSTTPVVKKYLELAKRQKKWQAKQAFEGALKAFGDKHKLNYYEWL